MSSDAETTPVDGQTEEHANGEENGEPIQGIIDNGYYYPLGKILHITNVPPSLIFTYVEELTDIFKKYGEIESIKQGGLLVDGLGQDICITVYVSFVNQDVSEQALAENGTILAGVPLAVTIIRAGPFTMKIDNVPSRVSTECLKNLLTPCGTIKEIHKIPNPKRFGLFIVLIEFEDEESLNKALALNGKLLVNSLRLSSVKLTFGKFTMENTPKKMTKMKLKRLHNEKIRNMNRESGREWGPGWQGNNRPPYRGVQRGIPSRGHQWGGRGGGRPFRGGNNYKNFW